MLKRIAIFLIINLLMVVLFSSVHASLKEVKTGKISGGLGDALEHAIPSWFKDSFLDIEDDVAQASSEKKHVMLFFYLNDCPYCYKMLKDSFSETGHQQFIKDNFDVIAINTKGDREVAFTQELSLTEKQLTQKLKVQYTPAILFLDANNKIVTRLNGYRSANKFKSVLNYVSNRAYEVLSLSEYLSQQESQNNYVFRKNPMFQSIANFSNIKTPLAIVFEDKSCVACLDWHNNILNNEEVIKELKKFTIVRLDAESEEEIIALDGHKTTAKNWARSAAITYRPGILLYDQGREVTRIDGMLYSFHFKEVFRYVSSRAYLQHNSYLEYLAKRQTELLNKGININIAN